MRGVDPEGLDFRPRDIGVVDVRKDPDPRVGPYPPRVRRNCPPLVSLYRPRVALALLTPANQRPADGIGVSTPVRGGVNPE